MLAPKTNLQLKAKSVSNRPRRVPIALKAIAQIESISDYSADNSAPQPQPCVAVKLHPFSSKAPRANKTQNQLKDYLQRQKIFSMQLRTLSVTLIGRAREADARPADQLKTSISSMITLPTLESSSFLNKRVKRRKN